jgi:hypothetical protein
MLIHLLDYRFILDGLVQDYSAPDSDPAPHHLVRYLIEWWPDDVRREWAKRVAALESTGLGWRQAEWQSFVYIANDTKRYEERNPSKPIKWHYPYKSEIIDINDHHQLNPDSYFYSNLQSGAEYNTSLGPSANEQLDALEKQIKETEKQLASTLSLEKETTVKKRSTVKKEPKAKEAKQSRKKSKFDGGMGALFS